MPAGYTGSVYGRSGTPAGHTETVVATGGKITIQSGGELELQSGATLDIQAGATANIGAVTVSYADDAVLAIGASDDAQLSWDTADANANHLKLQLPTGTATDVPVFSIGTATAIALLDTDLAVFNGTTQTTLAIWDNDGDSYLTISYSADDTPQIAVGGAATTLNIANGIYMPGGTALVGIKLGTLSSTTAGSGLLVDDSITRALEVHADDNNAARAVGTQGRAIFGRTMIYADNACEDWGIHGLSKVSGVAKTGNVSAGVVGAFESTGTCSTATGSGNTFCAGVMGRVGTGGAFTIGAGTQVACVLAFGNNSQANAFTNTGYCGFMATVSDIASTQKFDNALYIDPACCVKGILIGADSNSAGSGIPLDATNYSGNGFYADDGGTLLAAGYTECFTARYLVSVAITGDTDVSIAAVHADIYSPVNISTRGGMSALWGGFAVPTGVTLTTSAGSGDFGGGHFSIDVPSGATIAASTFACGLSMGGNLGGTHTGKAVAFRVRSPSAGAWDGLFDIPSALSGGADGSGSAVYIDCYINGVAARLTAKYVS